MPGPTLEVHVAASEVGVVECSVARADPAGPGATPSNIAVQIAASAFLALIYPLAVYTPLLGGHEHRDATHDRVDKSLLIV